eukprot:scaffold25626_cov60-Phaeocystis_antarctica.AAC.4
MGSYSRPSSLSATPSRLSAMPPSRLSAVCSSTSAVCSSRCCGCCGGSPLGPAPLPRLIDGPAERERDRVGLSAGGSTRVVAAAAARGALAHEVGATTGGAANPRVAAAPTALASIAEPRFVAIGSPSSSEVPDAARRGRALRWKLARRRCCSAALSPSAPRTAKGLCVPKTLG